MGIAGFMGEIDEEREREREPSTFNDSISGSTRRSRRM